MWSKAFWAAAAERAVRTTAQAMLSLWLVGDLALNALSVDWGEAAGVGLGAALVSLLMSLTASAAQPQTGASFGVERPNTPSR